MSKLENWNKYINELVEVKDELEHSGRTYLENLLKSFLEADIKVKHEPKRDKKGRGAPDFLFLSNDTPIGYLENKKIGEDLDKVLDSDQIKKYSNLTNNLILTDYLRWIWIYEGKVTKDVRLCEKTLLEQKKIKLDNSNIEKVSSLIEGFFISKSKSYN